jgi:hypothetical protein
MSNKIEGIPAGWEFVKVGAVVSGDEYVDKFGEVETADFESVSKNYVIVRKIEPPKPVYVAWTFETCPRGVWVRHNTNGFEASVLFVSLTRVVIGISSYTFDDLLKGFTQLDGTPCGTIQEAK